MGTIKILFTPSRDFSAIFGNFRRFSCVRERVQAICTIRLNGRVTGCAHDKQYWVAEVHGGARGPGRDTERRKDEKTKRRKDEKTKRRKDEKMERWKDEKTKRRKDEKTGGLLVLKGCLAARRACTVAKGPGGGRGEGGMGMGPSVY